jgi:hypothetical protein
VQNSLLKVEVDISSVSLNFYFYVHLDLILKKMIAAGTGSKLEKRPNRR